MTNALATPRSSISNGLCAENIFSSERVEAKRRDVGLLPYRTALYNYAMSLTRCREDSEDLVQETFARAIPSQKGLRDENNLKCWLFTILKHVWLNEVRRRRNAPQYSSPSPDKDIFESIPSSSLGPGEVYMESFDRDRVQKSIEELSPRLKEIIVLREYAELSYRDIAAVLGCPVGTVMSRLTRARQKLHTSLSGIA